MGPGCQPGGRSQGTWKAEVGLRPEGLQRAGGQFTGPSPGATWRGERPGPESGEKVS